MDDIDINVAKAVAMGETISNLAHAYGRLNDEEMQNIVKMASNLCLQMMLPRRPKAEVVAMDGGKVQ